MADVGAPATADTEPDGGVESLRAEMENLAAEWAAQAVKQERWCKHESSRVHAEHAKQLREVLTRPPAAPAGGSAMAADGPEPEELSTIPDGEKGRLVIADWLTWCRQGNKDPMSKSGQHVLRAMIDEVADPSLAASPKPTPSPGQGDAIQVDVQTMKTSAGADYYVRIVCEGREVTPYMFKDRFKAEYEADHFKWIFGLREVEPDVLAYDETTHPNTLPAPPTSSSSGGE